MIYFLKQSEKFKRPEELMFLKGDSSKIRKTLKWKPNYTFEMLVDEMIDFWMKNYDKKLVRRQKMAAIRRQL